MAAVWRSILDRRHTASSILFHSSSLLLRRSFTSYNLTHLINHNNDDESELLPYERALKYKRPPTIKYYPHTHRDTDFYNSVSLIGVVTRPVCPINTKNGGNAGAYTVLKVNNTSSSSQSTHRHVWYVIYLCLCSVLLIVYQCTYATGLLYCSGFSMFR